jgi:hypothetical protein
VCRCHIVFSCSISHDRLPVYVMPRLTCGQLAWCCSSCWVGTRHSGARMSQHCLSRSGAASLVLTTLSGMSLATGGLGRAWYRLHACTLVPYDMCCSFCMYACVLTLQCQGFKTAPRISLHTCPTCQRCVTPALHVARTSTAYLAPALKLLPAARLARCERTDLCSSLKATSYLSATLDQEGPAQLSWYSKWAVHAGKLAACRHHRQSHL